MDEIEYAQTVAAQEEYEMTASLFKAMAHAFPEIESATKDKTNPAFRSKYADLAAVVEAIKPALVKHGLFFAQRTHEQPGGVCVETIVCHESGEQMSFGKLFVPATKQDAQGYGSALTYARRYSLMAAFGVPAEDDDGNAAAKAKQAETERAMDIGKMIDAINGSANNAELRKHYDAAIAIAAAEHHDALKLAKNTRYRALNPKTPEAA